MLQNKDIVFAEGEKDSSIVYIYITTGNTLKELWRFQDFIPVDTGRKLNVHKTFRRRPGCLLNVLCTFNLRPVSAVMLKIFYSYKRYKVSNLIVIVFIEQPEPISNSNGIRTHNQLVRKGILNHLIKLVSLAKWLNVRL